MMYYRAFVLLMVLALLHTLGGCAHKPEVPTVPGTLEGVRTEVNVDARLLEPCSDLGDIKTNPAPSEVLNQHGADVKVHNECKERHGKLVDVVKRAFNLK